MRILLHETISVPTPSCHASTMAMTPDGLIAAWFGGTREGAPDCSIYVARRKRQGWEKPAVAASKPGMPHWNPVLYAINDQVWLFYKTGVTIPGWRTWVISSGDGGYTFSAPRELVPGDIGGRGPVKNKPLLLADGRVLCPASVETLTHWDAFVDITDPAFASLRQSKRVPLQRGQSPVIPGVQQVLGKGVIQPALWQTRDGGVHMLLRSTENRVLRSDSSDGGETWCTAYATELPNNNSGLDVQLLPYGHVVVALNPVAGNPGPRTPLCLYQSNDGHRFAHALTLREEPGEYSYPTLLWDGLYLHMSYTVNRVMIGYAMIAVDA